MNVDTCRDDADVARVAAGRFIEIGNDAIHSNGSFTVALAGGSTPRALYALLASNDYEGRVDWSRVLVFWGDERCVPLDHKNSNFKMAWDTLLSRIAIPSENVHRMPTELGPDAAACAYAAVLKKAFELPSGAFPSLDLILLGMGADGHTASLFPHTAAINETRRLVVAHFVDRLDTHRLTLTPPVLTGAANVLFLVTGENKAQALKRVLKDPYRPSEFPAQLLRHATGAVTWIIDYAAAGKL